MSKSKREKADANIEDPTFDQVRNSVLFLANILKALAYYTRNCKKCSYLPYTLQFFFTTATILSIVFYVDNDFHNDFLKKSL